MLIKSQNCRVSYITRLLALPILLLVAAAFTLKPSRINEKSFINTKSEEKTWTFVIDAAHGGTDNGVATYEGLKEKELNLTIALKIKELNKNPAFRIILTRESDIFMNVREKVDFTVLQKPDAFVSIHINAAPSDKLNGIEVFLGSKNHAFEKENNILGSLINQEMAKVYQTLDTLRKRSTGIWVLDAPQIKYPAAIVECGYLSNPKDRAFISDPKNQEKIALKILAALEKYAALSASTTIPPGNAKSLNSMAKQEGFLNDTGVVTLEKTSMSISTDDPAEEKRLRDKMVVINGKTSTMATLINKTVEADSARLYPENDPAALKLYGEPARNGVTVFYNARVWDTPEKTTPKDTLPKGISSVDITEDGNVIVIDAYGKAEKITRQEAYNRNLIPLAKLESTSVNPTVNVTGTFTVRGNSQDVLYIVDGVKINKETGKDALDLIIKPEDIASIHVIKDKAALDQYGEKGKNGVVVITTKKISATNTKKQ